MPSACKGLTEATSPQAAQRASRGSPPEFFPFSPTVISCPPPPAIPRGQHSGNSSEQFVFGSVTTYTCEPGLELVGQDTLLCTVGDNGDNGTWSGAPPTCRGEHSSPYHHHHPLITTIISSSPPFLHHHHPLPPQFALAGLIITLNYS